MSEYSSLKAIINASIKANNNQEITGSVMNSVLNAMVNTLGAGYQFAGVATTATNPGTPDAKVFYIANGKGTYTNFGSLKVTEDEVVVLYWDTAWHKEATGIASQAKLTELESEVLKVSTTFQQKAGWHSATKDKISIILKKGDVFSVQVLNASIGDDLRMQVYAWKGSEYFQFSNAVLGEKAFFVANDNYDSVSVGFMNASYSANVTIVIGSVLASRAEKAALIVPQDLTESEQYDARTNIDAVPQHSIGYITKSLTLSSGSHSSNADRISITIPEGDLFAVKVDANTATLGDTFQVAMRYAGADSDEMSSKQNMGEYAFFTAKETINEIGIYFTVLTSGKVTLTILTGMSALSQASGLMPVYLEFYGKDKTYSKHKIQGCKGITYRIIPLNADNWNVSNIPGEYNRYYVSQNGVDILSYKVSQTLWNFVEFTLPDNGDVEIGIRANYNNLVQLYIYPYYKSPFEYTAEEIVNNKISQFSLPYHDGSVAKTPQLLLLHFSDIHGSKTQLERIMNFANNHGLSNILCTGDCVFNYMDENDNGVDRGFSFWDNCGAEKVMNCIGNHDATAIGGEVGGVPISTVYNKFISPYIGTWGAVGAGVNLNYYYKDFTDEKIRLIVLDSVYWDDAQNQWLKSTLAGSKTNGYSVICACHYPFANAIHTYNTFDAYLAESLGSQIMSAEAVEAVDDFIDNNGEFVCWLSGHTHRDMFTYVGRNQQLTINIAEAFCGRGQGIYGDMNRKAGTPSQDLFNIISVDSYGKMLRIMRIGSNVDRLGRNRKVIVYNYNKHEVIYED